MRIRLPRWFVGGFRELKRAEFYEPGYGKLLARQVAARERVLRAGQEVDKPVRRASIVKLVSR